MRLHLRNLHLVQRAFELKIDLEVSGEAIGLFGNSGAGKTSLLEIVAGLRKPQSGRIQIDETLLMDRGARIFTPPNRRSIGYVPQDLALFPHLSVRQNLAYGRSYTTYRRYTASAPAFEQVTHLLEIEPLLERSVRQLSGGQQQRVAFARALLTRPRLLLLDEPLSGLHQELKLKIIPYLQRIRNEYKIPLLYVSHSPDELMALCDRVLVLQAGRCLRICPPTEIFEPSTSMVLKPGVLSPNDPGQPPAS